MATFPFLSTVSYYLINFVDRILLLGKLRNKYNSWLYKCIKTRTFLIETEENASVESTRVSKNLASTSGASSSPLH